MLWKRGAPFALTLLLVGSASVGPQPLDQQEVAQRMRQAEERIRERVQAFDADVYHPTEVTNLDKVILKGDRVLVGKVIELGTWLIVVDRLQRHVLRREQAERVEFMRDPEDRAMPDLPDLDVTFIERTPRFRSNHGNVPYADGIPQPLTQPNDDPMWPAAGSTVTFTGHVRNKGKRPSGAFDYAWYIDGRRAKRGDAASLEAGAEFTDRLQWQWRDGQHTVELRVDEKGAIEEVAERNNRLRDRTDALGILIWASEHAYAGFNGVRNMVESFSFEDWAQFHFEQMNFLFAESIWPATPDGCLERLRIDNIVVVPDEDPARSAALDEVQRDGHESGCYYEGRWGFAPWDEYEMRAARVDWGFLHETAHQLGLIDRYRENHEPWRTLARDREGNYLNFSHFTDTPRVMMHWHGPHRFSEQSSAALNAQIGRHRGYFGDYLYCLPKQMELRFLDRANRLLVGAEVRIFQRTANGWSYIPREPIYEGKTDAAGGLVLTDRPAPHVTTWADFTQRDNPFGWIQVLGDTGLLLVEVSAREATDYHWVTIDTFNVAYFRGDTERYVHTLRTTIPALDAPEPPADVRVQYHSPQDVSVTWRPSPSADVQEYRVYLLRDRRLPSHHPWEEVARTRSAQTTGVRLRLNAGHNHVVVVAVDGAGIESAFSPRLYCPIASVTKLAVNSKGERYLASWDRLLRQRPDGTFVDFEYRCGELPHGRVMSVAIDGQDRLYLALPEQGKVYVTEADGTFVAAFADKGARPGQLDRPMDIALDGRGSVFVADTGNDRVCRFTTEGEFVATIEAGLSKPEGIFACPDGSILVADTGNDRAVRLKPGDAGWEVVAEYGANVKAPLDVVEWRGLVLVGNREASGLAAFDAAEGGARGTVAEYRGTPLWGITGLALDRGGSLFAADGRQGKVLAIDFDRLRDDLKP